MKTRVVLRQRTPPRWNGNGFGRERASYDLMFAGDYIAKVEPTRSGHGWDVTIDGKEGPDSRLFFDTLAEVRAWGNKQIQYEPEPRAALAYEYPA